MGCLDLFTSSTIEDTVIASLRSENEIENFLFNTLNEQLVTLDKIRIEDKINDFILKIKKQETSTGNKYKKRITENNTFSICDDVREEWW